MSGLYWLHGALAQPWERPAPNGLFGAPLAFLRAHGLWIAGSWFAGTAEDLEARFADPAEAAQLAIAHHTLLVHLAEHADVAPIALGAAATAEKLEAVLAPQRAALAAALGRIAGCVEFAVKLLPGKAASAPPEPPADAADGRAYLRALQAAREGRRTALAAREHLLEAMAAAFAACARERVSLPPRNGAVLQLALLVPRSDTTVLLETAALWAVRAESHGLQLELSGPWPVYSFAAAPSEAAA